MLQDQLPATRTDVPAGKVAGAIMIVAALLTVIAVSHHPTVASHSPQRLLAAVVAVSPMDQIMHGTMIAIVVAMLFALCVFTLRRGLRELTAVAGLIAYALGSSAVIGAALIDGFLTPALGARYALASPDDARVGIQMLVLAAMAIQVLTKFGLIAISAGVLSWSAGLLRGSAALVRVGILGIASAVVAVAVFAAGGAYITPHLLVIIVTVQGLWYLAVGALMVRGEL